MPDNAAPNAANEPDDVTPREAVLKAMQAAMAKITCVRAGRSFITEGLRYLKQLSKGKLEFHEVTPGNSSDLMLVSELEKKNDASVTTLRLTPEGEIFTNAGGSKTAATNEPFVPEQEDEDKATAHADNATRFMGNVATEVWKQFYDEALEGIRRSAQFNSRTTAVSAPATADEALAAIAREAVLQDFITAVPEETDGLRPAQKAIVDGLRRGFRARANNIDAIKGAAKPFLSGLALLEKLSNGQIRVVSDMLSDGSAMEIKIASPTGSADKFGITFLKVHGTGEVQWGSGGRNYIAQKFEAMDEQDIINILSAIAKPAVFAGKIPPTALQQIDTDGAEQEIVLAAIHKAEGERASAHVAASNLTDGLKELKRQLPGRFDFAIEESADTAEVIVVLNPGKPSAVEIPVTADGWAKFNGTEYKVDEPAGAAIALTDITNEVMKPLTWRRSGPRKPSF